MAPDRFELKIAIITHAEPHHDCENSHGNPAYTTLGYFTHFDSACSFLTTLARAFVQFAPPQAPLFLGKVVDRSLTPPDYVCAIDADPGCCNHEHYGEFRNVI